MSGEEAGRALFPETDREAARRILDFLHDLVESLEQMYLNGTKPELGKRYNQRIRADARIVIRTLSAHLDTDGTQSLPSQVPHSLRSDSFLGLGDLDVRE